METAGNTDCHVILRGGTRGPNHDAESVAAAVAAVGKVGLPGLVMVDASHANSGKSHERQAEVVAELAERIGGGEQGISGLMIESFIEPGAQSVEAEELVYGQSVTDACMGWDTTADGLRALAAAVRAGRRD